MNRWAKITIVIVGALSLTALGIDAADTLSGSGGTLLGQIIGSKNEGGCPPGMVFVPSALSFTCVDIYEASASEDCPHTDPRNEIESKENVVDTSCRAISEKERMPWRSLTREQASLACMRAGKRLPKSAEWYVASAGTPSEGGACTVDDNSVKETGSRESCKAISGMYDGVGNAWEWVSDDVIDGMYNNRKLPHDGYVQSVDEFGLATETGGDPSALFYDDYFWSESSGAFGILRGGFYASGNDAGVYAMHAKTLPTTAGDAIGFRCIK